MFIYNLQKKGEKLKTLENLKLWCQKIDKPNSINWNDLDKDNLEILQPIKNEFEKISQDLIKAKEELEFYRHAIDYLPNPIFIKDKNAKFMFFNKAYEQFFGIKKENFISKSVLELDYLAPSAKEAYQKEDLQLIENADINHYCSIFKIKTGESKISLYWSKGFHINNSYQKGLIGEIVDVTREKQVEIELIQTVKKLKIANKMIEENSKLDTLTGLYSRSILIDQMKCFAKLFEEQNIDFCVLMADLDFFKKVNDTYGHKVGDEILIKFAKILNNSCRKNDICIRYRGEEFLIILPEVTLEKAQKVADRILKNTEKQLLLPDNKPITTSIGLTSYRKNDNIDQCLIRVDELLYEAKNKGRNRIISR
ncbi:sensor domain-containing diguanylate cyclase [Campylobacter sputorum]|uniref:sensor domain-containing diguanylate cyclase n=1 Tax=Campylobacter sputorum TaxID=206 RepID=UPI001E3BF884|nr:GGDEF domain-containing protein [Campylobacter sputorum]